MLTLIFRLGFGRISLHSCSLFNNQAEFLRQEHLLPLPVSTGIQGLANIQKCRCHVVYLLCSVVLLQAVLSSNNLDTAGRLAIATMGSGDDGVLQQKKYDCLILRA